MTQCWSEGELRAYLDRELTPGEIQRAGTHLKECTACDGLCRELAGTAARVSALVDLLPELEGETLYVPARMPARTGGRPRAGWVGAAVALAAGLGIVAYLAPVRKVPVVAEPARTVQAAVAPAVSAVAAPEAVREPAMAVRSARNSARTARRKVLDAGDFVALDDEPFESGVILRVAVTPGQTQADIVFGPDGRARAFRLVKAPNQKF